MIRFPHLILSAVGFLSALGSAPHGRFDLPTRTVVDSTEPWFRFFSGTWQCTGGFPSGRKLEAAVHFTPDLSGRWLEYRHADLAPGTYQTVAFWGHPGKDTTLISLLHDNGGGARLYRSSGWDGNALVWVKDTSVLRPAGASASAPDRFSYRKVSDSTFWFGWELSRPGGAWAVGDSLTCKRGR